MSYLVSKLSSKKQALPNFLFYERKVSSSVSKQKEYVAFSTKNPKVWGELILRKSNVQHREDYAGPTLAVDFILSKLKDKKLGTAMMNFAKNYSKQNGCNGYVILRADGSLSPQRVPQIFYRKQGFSTLDKKRDAKMDEFIKKDSFATTKDFVVDIMHYPPLKDEQKPSFKERFLKIINRFF